MLTPAEREQLVSGWNQTSTEYPSDSGVHQLFELQVARTPDATAVVFGDRVVTYAELNGRANRLADYLRHLGVTSETIVGVLLERSADMVVTVLGILKAGGAYLPLDPLFPAERLAYMLEDSKAAILVTHSSLLGTLATPPARTVSLDTDWPRIVQYSQEDLPRLPAGESLAYLLYTSGSTGRPKGVQVLHRNVVNFLTSMRERPGLSPADILLSVTSLSFDIAALELFLPLSTGAQVTLVDSAVAADGVRLLRTLDGSGATMMQATPATWRLLLAAGWQGTPALRVLCGGEVLPGQLATQLLSRCSSLWNMYGPTETTIWSTIHHVTSADTANVPIGRPIANTRVYVLDGRLQPVPIGVTGELYIGGEGVARGYFNQAELTAQRYLADPFTTQPNARMYRTGDLVRFRSDGTLEYLERIDTQVKLRGYRIELGEIEAAVKTHPGIDQAVVLVREDVPLDKRLVAYITPAGSSARERAVREHLVRTLPAYMVPSRVVSLDSIPLTSNGKIDRKALPPPEIGPADQSRPRVLPRTAAECAIAAIWEEVLNVGPVGIHDNFFDLGGHSLLMLQVHARLHQLAESGPTVAQLFQYPTVEALARWLERPSLQPVRIDHAHARGQRQRAALEKRAQSVQHTKLEHD